jgi:GT2 family glycosyltransferase
MSDSAAPVATSTSADVSIVVVNYNAGRLLADCVALGLKHADQVIVVDNASNDDSLARLTERFRDVCALVVERNASNLGFAAACNIGARLAVGRFVLFLNPDCLLEAGSVSEMMLALDKDPRAGMAGGLLLEADGTEQAGARRAVPTPWRSLVRVCHLSRFEKRWPRLFSDFNLHRKPLPFGPVEVEAISGACTMVKREAMEGVGEWDEGYFLHCEDLDLCMRYRDNGWSILFVPSARIMHFQGTCSRSRPWFVEWHKHRGMMRFYRKFFRHQYPGVLMWLVFAFVWTRFAALLMSIGIIKVLGDRRSANPK